MFPVFSLFFPFITDRSTNYATPQVRMGMIMNKVFPSECTAHLSAQSGARSFHVVYAQFSQYLRHQNATLSRDTSVVMSYNLHQVLVSETDAIEDIKTERKETFQKFNVQERYIVPSRQQSHPRSKEGARLNVAEVMNQNNPQYFQPSKTDA